MLEEARVEPIVMVMGRLEWFGHMKRRHRMENIRAVAETKMEGKLRGGRFETEVLTLSEGTGNPGS